MSKIKEAMFNTIYYQQELEAANDDGTVSIELAREMTHVIAKLEYELALYKTGCDKTEVDKIMAHAK